MRGEDQFGSSEEDYPQFQINTWAYDAVTGGVTRSDTQAFLPNGSFVDLGAVNHSYDQATGRLLRTWTSNNETDYAYDGLGRLSTVTAVKRNGVTTVAPENTTYAYDGIGNLASETIANGDVITFTYDGLNRLVDQKTKTASGDLLSEYAYTLRDDGLRDHVVETTSNNVTGTGTFSHREIDWTYDALGRLIAEARQAPIVGTTTATPDGTEYTATYAFDLAGNRTKYEKTNSSSNETVISFTDADDHLMQESSSVGGNTTYTYDANGSQTAKTHGTAVAYYGWDLRNRMNFAYIGGVPTYYTYDADGYRVGEMTGTSSRTFTKDSANPTGYPQAIEEKVNGTLNRSYVLGMRVEAQTDSSGLAYLLRDGHGSVTELAASNGNLIADPATGNPLAYAYDAFGSTIGFNAATARTTQLFGGDGEYDPAVGMSYHDARFRQGYRFISMDPPGYGNNAGKTSAVCNKVGSEEARAVVLDKRTLVSVDKRGSLQKAEVLPTPIRRRCTNICTQAQTHSTRSTRPGTPLCLTL